ncbi:hypothetical protein PGAG_00069 [Phaeocystis globosa virus 12T]|uniref:Uncharacterized protein n=1 Tax=Phaeocystis globosa virus PgV-16T TaxID=3071227 RepID=A0AC59EWW1_9VIRU|nr:hypothetical protein PGCG_00109 [Phaeocystis globosa virus]AET72959.1 hypothetical protein PGAG_00069 [Phaeocystis globosa virus 12T]AET73777.1 hypothetical protein PGBG_00069 [Phaeocystis globosa virus 14T]AGM15421.1 hypothetical protein PGCG_00109 [Phaeocystis globosa virus PgV-16T]UYE94151.1 hypothetical protein PGV14T_00109 [Phaeocystis globosa virus]
MNPQDKWYMKAKEFSGEMYDLTASSSISTTGGYKFNAATKYGITETFEKYIQELFYMTDDEADDKFYKRMERLTFLTDCKEFDEKMHEYTKDLEELQPLNTPHLQNLFGFTCNYLNGSDGINQYTNQPITVILSGGNVTTIYINLLKNLLSHNKDDMDGFISIYFGSITKDSIPYDELFTILDNIKTIFELVPRELADPIEAIKLELANTKLKLSDLDFIIVPNKMEIIDSLFTKGGGGPTEPGVSLRRTKRNREPTEPTYAHIQAAEIAANKERNEEKKAKKREAEKKEAETKAAEPKTNRTAKTRPQKTIGKNTRKVKNEPIVFNEIDMKEAEAATESKSTEGVLLIRMKTANKYGDLQTSHTKMSKEIQDIIKMVNKHYKIDETGCYNDLEKLKTTIQLLRQPQLFRLNYLSEPDVADLCKDYLSKMQAQKRLISIMTDLNLEHLINCISYEYLPKTEQVRHSASEYVENDPTKKLANFMMFVHINGTNQNKLIENLCKGEPVVSYAYAGDKIQTNTKLDTPYRSAQQVVTNFKSLEHITNANRPLVKIMCELALEFSNNDIVKNTLKRISGSYGPLPDVTPGKYASITPTTYTLSPLHSRLKFSTASLFAAPLAMEESIENDEAEPNIIIPNNSKISTNIFTPIKLESKTKPMTKAEERELLRGIGLIKSSEEMLQDDLIDIEEEMAKMNLASGGKKTKTKKRKGIPIKPKQTRVLKDKKKVRTRKGKYNKTKRHH